MKVYGLVSATLEVVNTVKEVFERGGTYFCKKLSSTTAEISRSGFPIPSKIPSDAIFFVICRRDESRWWDAAADASRKEWGSSWRKENGGSWVYSKRGLLRGFIVFYLVPLLSISFYSGAYNVFLSQSHPCCSFTSQ